MVKVVSQIKKFLASFYGRALLPALFLRLLMMPFFYHPDIKSHHFHFYFLSQKVINLYQYLANHALSLPYTDTFNYPPLVYFVFGSFQLALRPLLGSDFVHWLFDWGPEQILNPHLFRYLFILKLPYLVLDLATAFLLTSFFKTEAQKKKVFVLWLFNPVVWYALYGLSHFDILPAFLVLWSMAWLNQNKVWHSGLFLGLAAAFKTYPLLLLPFLAILASRRLKKIIFVFLAGMGLYLATLLPFFNSGEFRQSVLFSGLSQRLFQAGINLGFGENLIIFVVLVTGLFFFIQKTWPGRREKTIPVFLAVLLLIFSLSHFHPQWIVWLLPFLTILLVQQPKTLLPQIIFYLAFFGVVFLFDDVAQTFGLLTPINPSFLSFSSLFMILKNRQIFDPQLLQSLCHSVLAGTSFWLIWQSFKKS